MTRAFFQRIIGLLAIATLLAAAGASAAPKELPLLFDARERIAKPDLTALARLRFLTTVDFPPFNFIDQSGKLSGFHVDLAREICRELEIEAKCQIQAVTYPELMPALEQGQGEAIIAGVAVTPELRRRFAFSRAFMTKKKGRPQWAGPPIVSGQASGSRRLLRLAIGIEAAVEGLALFGHLLQERRRLEVVAIFLGKLLAERDEGLGAHGKSLDRRRGSAERLRPEPRRRTRGARLPS